MAIFGSRRSLVQRAANRAWRNDADREKLMEDLRKASLSASDGQQLIFSGDPGLRSLGAEVFLNAPKAKELKALVLASQDQGRHARTYVLRMMGRVSDEAFQGVVDDLLRDKAPKVQKLGWELAMEATGALAARYLRSATTDGPEAQRPNALKRLLQAVDPTDEMDLLLSVARSDDQRLATVALEALSNLTDPRIADLMIDRFANGDATAREYAGTWLRDEAKRAPERMRGQMLDLLGGEDATRRMCVEILLLTGPPDEVLLEILRFSKDLVGWLRTRILETLQTFGEIMLRPAVALLQHEDEQLRTSALVLAEQFNDPRVVGPVCRLLSHDDWWLRITACDTLGRLGDARAVPPLVKALEDADARWAAIDALARIGSPKALQPLTRLLRDKRQEVRLEVLQALTHFDDKRLVPLLKQVMEQDTSKEVRIRAGEILRDLSARLDLSVDTSVSKAAVSSKSLSRGIDKLLAKIREEGASDLHVTVDEPPLVRMNGVLTRWKKMGALSAEQTEAAILEVLDERQKELLQKNGAVDFCHAIPEVGRYRANAYLQRKGMCAAFRVIPNTPPTFADLRLPGHLTDLLDYHQGIIVVSGPAGSGKSTTLAAIINLINESKPEHVLTLEDPIEFVHPVKVGLVNQREVGKHSTSFARALRGALRQDPDVIMVGEMRDPETIRMSLEAAETGHLVIATMHTTSAIQTVERLVTAFPPDEQAAVRMSLSESLKYVVSQSLIPRKDGVGRVAVFEVLKGTLSVGNLIRDNKTFQLPSMMQIGRSVGMQNVDMALMDLVEADLITAEVAWARADNPENFAPLCDPQFLMNAATGGGGSTEDADATAEEAS